MAERAKPSDFEDATVAWIGDPDMDAVRAMLEDELADIDREIERLRANTTRAFEVLAAARRAHEHMDLALIQAVRSRALIVRDIEELKSA